MQVGAQGMQVGAQGVQVGAQGMQVGALGMQVGAQGMQRVRVQGMQGVSPGYAYSVVYTVWYT